MKDTSIELYSQKENYKGIQEFFKFFLNYVKPDRMRIVASFTNKAYDKKFNEKKFFEEISNEKYKNKYHTIFINGKSLLDPSISYNPNRMYISMNKEVYMENKEEIDNVISNLFQKIQADIGFLEDDTYRYLENEEDIEGFEEAGGKLIEDRVVKIGNEFRIDISKNPGHTKTINGLPVGVYWKMWIGHDYYRYLSQKKLSEYDNCYENIELEDGSRKIVMTETLDEFISEKTDDMKWDFREKMELKKVEEMLYNLPEEDIPDGELLEETIISKDGKAEYTLTYFDDNMEWMEKAYATKYYLIKHLLDEEGNWISEDGEITKTGWLKNLDFEKLYNGEI
ncbi:hypothetical protein [Leptotrichia sp. oral taxon 221]|uniref:hypothetical protein n=1 Tax=Leptotrichia sp. oral taxon 221 TaxID=712362 RepID=UPI001B8C0595|nr:hypothetical protein [Leptotrichia sp. oral taxon 221]QUB96418.1 hypothetical protein J4863_04905 [Leptotrichia sp. oral taxon 221]